MYELLWSVVGGRGKNDRQYKSSIQYTSSDLCVSKLRRITLEHDQAFDKFALLLLIHSVVNDKTFSYVIIEC